MYGGRELDESRWLPGGESWLAEDCSMRHEQESRQRIPVGRSHKIGLIRSRVLFYCLYAQANVHVLGAGRRHGSGGVLLLDGVT